MVSIVQDERRSGASLSHASSLPFSSSAHLTKTGKWVRLWLPLPVASKTPLPHCPVLRQRQMTRLPPPLPRLCLPANAPKPWGSELVGSARSEVHLERFWLQAWLLHSSSWLREEVRQRSPGAAPAGGSVIAVSTAAGVPKLSLS